MMRRCVSRTVMLWSCVSRRAICGTHYIFQRGQWGGPRGGGGGSRRDYGDQGNQGDWGGPRGGGNRRDYGDQGNQGDWGGPRGGGGGNRRDYGDQGNQGDWGGPRGGGGGNRREYNDLGSRREESGFIRSRSYQGGCTEQEGHIPDKHSAEGTMHVEPLNEQAAKGLFDMKRQYKNAKTGKERRDIQREARRAIRRLRIDPSMQDEKAVTLLLNCAATFRSYPHSEGIKQATQWMRQNIGALSPQNLALFANAVGALSVTDSEHILLQEVSPAVQLLFMQMSPVELVMVLQAFQRARITTNTSLQESMLQRLASSVPQMPPPQLSTLANVLVDTPLRKNDEAAWKDLTGAVVSKAVSGADKMHSREAIALLRAASHLCVPEKDSLELINRAIATAGFHTEEQVGELLESIADYRNQEEKPGNELCTKLDELMSALWTRLEKVAPYADVASATLIMKQARRSGVDVPTPIMEAMLDAVMREIRFHRYTFRRLAALAEALALQNAAAKPLLHAVGDYCIGKRLPREDREETNKDDDETVTKDVRMDIYARFLGDLTRARIALEDAHDAHPDNGEPGENVAVVLAQRLEESIMSASPREVLKSLKAVCMASESCRLRNHANDEKIMALGEQRIAREREGFVNDLPKEVLERFFGAVGEVPRAQGVVRALSR